VQEQELLEYEEQEEYDGEAPAQEVLQELQAAYRS
jgi:hypothetical protein